jgi:hypothetical protein
MGPADARRAAVPSTPACGALTEGTGSGPRLFPYFNELLIDVNLRFNFVPPCSS